MVAIAVVVGFDAPMTLERFAAIRLLRVVEVVVVPVTVELRLRPPVFSFSPSPMMLCLARLAAVCLISTGLGRIYGVY